MARVMTPEQRESRRTYDREWARKNPGAKHAWRRANPDKARESARVSVARARAQNPAKWRARARREKGYPEPTRPEPTTCEICGQPPNGRTRTLHLDHDHKTGKFRGWLCDSHNRALGHFKDDPNLLRKAIAYLEANS